MPVASFHLVHHADRRHALAQLSVGRRRLAATPGLRFWRNLGTGAGGDTARSADLRRTALFAVWDDDAAAQQFRHTAWPRAAEQWSVLLQAIGGHGTWRGFDVLASIDRADDVAGPLAIITRADVRVSRWRRFDAVGEAVNEELRAAAGLIDVVGVGEAPIGRQGTFSLWRSAEDARRFATAGPHHREVVRRTRAERWYAEELFARFRPFDSAGTWNGRDPLA